MNDQKSPSLKFSDIYVKLSENFYIYINRFIHALVYFNRKSYINIKD